MYNNDTRRRHNRRPNSNVNDTFDNYDTQIILENFTNCLLIYTNPVDCINFIREIVKERILLIISGVLSQSALPQIHSLPTTTAIFIFCNDRQTYLPLLSEYSKITDVFTDQDSLMHSIQKTIHFISKQALTFSTFNHDKQKSTRNVSKDFGSFTWFQLLIDVLRKIPQTDRSKQDMLDTCREYCALNQIEMRKIKQFELTYDANQAIEWYTHNSFVYRLVNKGLRTEDVEIIYTFRFLYS
ncbi:unnamed protein product [Rotaria sordida]|uniref:Uncharacterized protein n=1 Tax=Rotaria sordida TaxID=392033 RepID=A0A815CV90_9BILA|nr:unnamed protein product [Rotaria sordida]CAF1414107.1 unnamed protein product [Rotaria sordida]CAF1442111.1 unnamed protein product [Rotaria sordida]CAF1568503.1 unnamed protein product [Rotaria sordida]CAF1568633.1 unnamed protein product [Rotaria sordida]